MSCRQSRRRFRSRRRRITNPVSSSVSFVRRYAEQAEPQADTSGRALDGVPQAAAVRRPRRSGAVSRMLTSPRAPAGPSLYQRATSSLLCEKARRKQDRRSPTVTALRLALIRQDGRRASHGRDGGQAAVLRDLQGPGSGGDGRDLACRANAAAGNGDASLRTKAEYLALFGLLAEEGQQGARPDLVVRDDAGRCPRSRGGGHASAQCSRPLLGLSSGKVEPRCRQIAKARVVFLDFGHEAPPVRAWPASGDGSRPICSGRAKATGAKAAPRAAPPAGDGYRSSAAVRATGTT
jgi:hypothetical protein